MSKNTIISIIVASGIIVVAGCAFLLGKDSTPKTSPNVIAKPTKIETPLAKPLTKNITQKNVATKNYNDNISTSNINDTNNNDTNNNKINITNNSFEMAKSTDDFSDIINGANYMDGTINGVNIIIPLVGGKIVNNQLILTEYYTSRLNEKFTLKISSIGNNNFIAYEFYNGEHTGTFKLKYFSNQSSLAGTFTHVGSNKVTGVRFNIWNSYNSGPEKGYPFLKGVVAGNNVLITTTGFSTWSEKYTGDNNIFKLSYNYNVPNKFHGVNTENKTPIQESYNGKVTGYYIFNRSISNKNYTGYYISLSNNNVYPFTFKGSYSPN